MTVVVQEVHAMAGTTRAQRRAAARETTETTESGSEDAARGRLAQVRLRPDEAAALDEVMAALHLESTSDVLREGLRRLVHEVAEMRAAEEIRAYYGDRPAPLPEGVAPATDEELAAADEIDW
jgi:hypothetical protein